KISLVNSELKDWDELQTFLIHINTCELENKKLKILTEIGSKVYANAFLKTSNIIMVKIGFAYHLEMTPDEANSFSQERIQFLNKKKESIMLAITDYKIQFEKGVALLNYVI
ncbi:hypothetical protein MXB_4351, partial [Myxobolus squamalis]